MTKNIFVLGLDDFNLAEMRALPAAADYRFHSLFGHHEVKARPEFPVRRLYEESIERLEHFPGPIDAIVGYWDFPVSTLLPLLCRHFDLPTPSFEAVLKCEHKYWSRLVQQRVVADCIPPFCVVNPFSDRYRDQIDLDYPFWIKPVRAASSILGFMVRNDRELEGAIEAIRAKVFRFSRPFDYLLEFADLPPEIAAIDGAHCIAEGIISRGRQCTLEGYAYRGEVQVYGAVDSIREGQHRSCFSRYQYPSSIPARVQQRMCDVTGRFLREIGFDHGPFNIEFYWDRHQDRIQLLEINNRISKSHCPLFRHVDGLSHHQVMLDLGLGRHPDFPHRQGPWRLAAKFMWRRYGNARVTRVPDHAEWRRLQEHFPSAQLQLHVQEGMRLSELKDQDSYSYEIAVIFLGADSQKALLQKYARLLQLMPLEMVPLECSTTGPALA
ncbi:ATP-grasp domain-containing protein [Halomonas nitroreducens]|uniref:ATP-grasp domain-containing protein n=1 Tax=Halomonas nitroreducens TaxID=447425 RepID=A0A3S0K0Y2_9GAMM|nr:ATP-grasp domain-containing protein [Halomonas nitroreducens]RTQ99603.1 ATP-grasp domain-containing protein [Halomonas nitroreducens]